MIYIAKGGFWLLLGKILVVLISLATMVAFANWLPAKTFGTYQFIISIAGVAAIAGLPGIKTAVVRSIAKRKEGSLSAAFVTKLRWSLLGSAVLLGIAGWYFINRNLLLASAFLVPAIFLPIKSSCGIFAGFWEGRKRFDIRTRLAVLSELGIAGALIFTLFVTNELWIILTAFWGATAAFYAMAYLYTQKMTRNKEIDKDLIPFGKNLTLMGVINTTASHLDRIILWKLLGPVQVAVYSFALKPIEKVSGLIPIQNLALPKLAEKDLKNKEQKKSIFRKFLLMFLLSVPLAAIIAVAAPFIYKSIFPQYMDSIPYFQVLSLLIVTLPIGILNTALIAEIKTRYLYITNIIVPLFKIVLFLALAALYGTWGVVIALLLSKILQGALSLYFFWKI